MQGEENEVICQLSAGDLISAQLEPAERRLLEFVELLTVHAYKTTREVVDRVRAAGWSDAQIAEAVYVTGLFAFFNRVADAFGLADPGFREKVARGEPVPKPAERHHG